ILLQRLVRPFHHGEILHELGSDRRNMQQRRRHALSRTRSVDEQLHPTLQLLPAKNHNALLDRSYLAADADRRRVHHAQEMESQIGMTFQLDFDLLLACITENSTQ